MIRPLFSGKTVNQKNKLLWNNCVKTYSLNVGDKLKNRKRFTYLCYQLIALHIEHLDNACAGASNLTAERVRRLKYF